MKPIPDKRAALLGAALELIAENGLSGVSTAAIARQAGVATGTLFLYFPSKDELIRALYREVQERIRDAVAAPDASLSFQERFEQMMTCFLRFFLEHPSLLIFCEYHHFSKYRDLDRDIVAPFQDLSALLQEAEAVGVVGELPVFVLESLAIAPLVSIAREHVSRGVTVDETLIAGIVRACWGAVACAGRTQHLEKL